MLAFAGLFLLGYFIPRGLWAFSNLYFLPLSIQIAVWFVLLALFFGEVDDIFVKGIVRFGEGFFKLRRRHREIAIFAFFLVVYYLFRSRNMLWGDSHMLAANIASFPATKSILWHHYGTAFLYKIVSVPIGHLLFAAGLSKQFSYLFGFNLISAVAGGSFAIIASRIADFSGRDGFNKAVILFGMLFCGVSLVFTHMEFYAPSLVLAAWGIYLAMRSAKAIPSRRWIFILPMSLAIALNPIFIYLAIIAIYFLFGRRNFVLRSLLFSVGFACIYMIIGSFADLPFCGHLLFSDPLYLFSGRHLLNVANFLLFAAPAALALPFARGRTESAKLLAGLSVPAILLVFILKFDYGAMDWDLAATILLPFAIVAALCLSRIPRKTAAIVVAAMFVFFASWLYLNADLDRGLDKGESTILAQRTEYFRRKPPEERLIQIYHRNIFRRKRHDRIEKWSSICREKYPYRVMPYIYAIFVDLEEDDADGAAYLALLAFDKTNIERRLLPTVINIIAQSDRAQLETVLVEIEKGGVPSEVTQSFPVDKKLEAELFRLAASDASPNPDRPRSLVEVLHIAGYISYYASIGEIERAAKVYLGGRKLYPNSPSIPNNWGIILNYLKRTEAARRAFETARSLGGDEGNFYSNMASSYYNDGDYAAAKRYILRALEVEPGKAMFNINYAAILFRLGRRREGIEVLREYIARADYESAKVTTEFMSEMGLLE